MEGKANHLILKNFSSSVAQKIHRQKKRLEDQVCAVFPVTSSLPVNHSTSAFMFSCSFHLTFEKQPKNKSTTLSGSPEPSSKSGITNQVSQLYWSFSKLILVRFLLLLQRSFSGIPSCLEVISIYMSWHQFKLNCPKLILSFLQELLPALLLNIGTTTFVLSSNSPSSPCPPFKNWNHPCIFQIFYCPPLVKDRALLTLLKYPLIAASFSVLVAMARLSSFGGDCFRQLNWSLFPQHLILQFLFVVLGKLV